MTCSRSPWQLGLQGESLDSRTEPRAGVRPEAQDTIGGGEVIGSPELARVSPPEVICSMAQGPHHPRSNPSGSQAETLCLPAA